MENHSQKIVDGFPIKYLCEPCPECKAKLEVAEEMVKALDAVIFAIATEKNLQFLKAWQGLGEGCKNVRSAWEKVGKAESE